ncbi:MAG: prepilin-type N-terminal cleavage/methylation domain-containing protein, partial [Pirellula sp.]
MSSRQGFTLVELLVV